MAVTKPIMLDETGKNIFNALNVIKNNAVYVKGEKGEDGKDYTITESDYNDIAEVTKNKLEPEIERIEDIAKGANQSIAYNDYSEMITIFNNLDGEKYKRGQNVYIVTLGVPDLWISDVEDSSEEYTYTSDEDFIQSLEIGGVQVGHYVFSMLETQKVDLNNYVKNTDYSSNNVAGVLKNGSGLYVSPSTGIVQGVSRTLEQYGTSASTYFICKATLENIKANYVKEGMAENMSYDASTETLTITTE